LQCDAETVVGAGVAAVGARAGDDAWLISRPPAGAPRCSSCGRRRAPHRREESGCHSGRSAPSRARAGRRRPRGVASPRAAAAGRRRARRGTPRRGPPARRSAYPSKAHRVPGNARSAILVAVEDDLEHEAGADVGEQQDAEADERHAQRDPAPPATQPAAEEERRKDRPGDEREQGLVLEAKGPAEDLLAEDEAAQQREGEQRATDRDEAKE